MARKVGIRASLTSLLVVGLLFVLWSPRRAVNSMSLEEGREWVDTCFTQATSDTAALRRFAGFLSRAVDEQAAGGVDTSLALKRFVMDECTPRLIWKVTTGEWWFP